MTDMRRPADRRLSRRHLLRLLPLVCGSAGLDPGRPGLAQPLPKPQLGVTPLPPAARELVVRNDAELAQALSVAEPGDHVVLANGHYAGPGAWSRTGTPQAPVVVRAAELLGARITESLDPSGRHLIVHGLDFLDGTMRIGQAMPSADVEIWRCRFRDRPEGTSIALRTDRVDGLDIAYCEWVAWGGRGISIGIAAGTRNFTIRRCLFRDTPGQRSADGAQLNATEAIQVGFADNDAAIRGANGRLEYNRFVNWNDDDEVVSVKASDCLVYRNTLENCWGNISNRSGRFNRYEANLIIDAGGFWNFDGPNLWLGNVQTGAHRRMTPNCWLVAGNRPAGSYPMPHEGSGRNTSEGCIVAGNRLSGELRVGHYISWDPPSVYPASGNRIRQHQGPVVLVPDWQTTTDSVPDAPETRHAWQTPLPLADRDVGPFA